MDISIVVPLYNESESLPHLVSAIASVLENQPHSYTVYFIDDGSTDNSYEILKKLHAEYPGKIATYRFTHNFGKSAALSAGIERAKGDVIITMDADLQDDPVAIPEMVALIEKGWDVVSGWKKKRHDPISKTIPSKLWNTITTRLSGLKLHDFNCGFKAYRSSVAKTLDIYGDRHRYLPVLAHWSGYKVTEMVVPHHPRKYGKTKFGIIGRSLGIFDLLTLLFLRKYLARPIHFFGILTLLFGSLGCAILAYFGIEWIITKQIHIRPLMLLGMGSILLSIQFFSIGLIGEMITNMQKRTTYSIREELLPS